MTPLIAKLSFFWFGVWACVTGLWALAELAHLQLFSPQNASLVWWTGVVLAALGVVTLVYSCTCKLQSNTTTAAAGELPADTDHFRSQCIPIWVSAGLIASSFLVLAALWTLAASYLVLDEVSWLREYVTDELITRLQILGWATLLIGGSLVVASIGYGARSRPFSRLIALLLVGFGCLPYIVYYGTMMLLVPECEQMLKCDGNEPQCRRLVERTTDGVNPQWESPFGSMRQRSEGGYADKHSVLPAQKITFFLSSVFSNTQGHIWRHRYLGDTSTLFGVIYMKTPVCR